MHASPRAFGAISTLFVSLAVTAADDPALDEIVVTADLRDRQLRHLPASATVLDANTLAVAGVQHFQDVMGLVPNLNWSAGTSRPRFFQLRGIGELEQWQGAPNPSVGFLIDGVDFSGVGMPATLADVETVEVLRGPQGTIYGANALAGLIAINTRAPGRDPEFHANASLGDHGTFGANAVLGGPLGSGETAWRFVAGRYRSDGFRRDVYLGRDDTNGYDESSARFRLSARPTADLGVDVSAMWVDLDNGYDAFAVDNSRVTRSDQPGQDAQISRSVALRLDYDAAENFQVVSLTSAGTSRSVYSFDGDWGNPDYWLQFTPDPYQYFQRFDRERRTLSQDLRFVSSGDVDRGADFAWLAGLYALRTDEDVGEHNVWNDLFGPGEEFFSSEYRSTNLAGYGELEWRLGSATVLAAGARVEHRQADYEDSAALGFSPDETMFGGSLTLRHSLAAGGNLYARLARGYKAGGFNIGSNLPPGAATFDTETLHNLELGWRHDEGGRWSADLALFYMRREDQQVPITEQRVQNDPLSFVLYTANAARGENYGVEGSVSWQPRESLLVDLRGALLETRYIGYQFGDRNLDGREQAHAPQYQFDLGFEYRQPAGFFARIDFAGLDDFYFDASHDERAPARVLTHLKTGFSGKHWRAEVWVRNLFDRYYAQRGFHFGLVPPEYADTRYVQAGDPRHLGVTVAYTFK